MTREQAKREIDSLDFYLQNHTDDYGEESHTAMMMAIKALEQQACEDAVSREAVLGLFAQNADATRPYSTAWEKIRDLPSVKPQYTEDEIQKMQDLEQAEIEKAYELGKAEQPKIGHWVVHPKGIYAHLICDNCLSNAPYDCRTNYCPDCGAKMVELQKSEVSE